MAFIDSQDSADRFAGMESGHTPDDQTLHARSSVIVGQTAHIESESIRTSLSTVVTSGVNMPPTDVEDGTRFGAHGTRGLDEANDVPVVAMFSRSRAERGTRLTEDFLRDVVEEKYGQPYFMDTVMPLAAKARTPLTYNTFMQDLLAYVRKIMGTKDALLRYATGRDGLIFDDEETQRIAAAGVVEILRLRGIEASEALEKQNLNGASEAADAA